VPISIIIPTLNEARRLPALLRRLAEEGEAHEIIVVDGGSRDGTVVAAERFGARVIACPRGRGRQLAAGAQAASGEVLLFLHADSEFPPGGLRAVAAILAAAPQRVGGNFRLVFDGGDAFSAWLTRFYAWLRRRGLYYGDSGIFLRRSVLQAIGGIRPYEVMEDFDLVRRLERAGPTICISEPPLATSSRRFAGRHPVAIVAGWLWIHALFLLGVPTLLLDGLYDSARQRRPD